MASDDFDDLWEAARRVARRMGMRIDRSDVRNGVMTTAPNISQQFFEIWRGDAVTRGLITGFATFVGGFAHALPFLIGDVGTALAVAYPVVAAELLAIAWIRKRFQNVSLRLSLIQVTLGGAMVAGVGFIVGHA